GVAGFHPLDLPNLAAGFGSLSATNSEVGSISGIDFAQLAVASNAEYSVEAWVKWSVSQAGDGAGIVVQGPGGGTENFDLDVSGTTYRFFFHDASGNTAAHQLNNNGAADGKWHHLVGVID